MKVIVIKILNILSKKLLDKYDPVVIGIAGSAGKSSVKKAICEVLRNKYKIAYNRDCYKTDIGIPLAIIGAESEGRSIIKWVRIILLAFKKIIKKTKYPEILILEMGVDNPNDMKKVLEIVKPNIGILTNIEKFPPRAKYFKSVLIKSLKKKDVAILNYDDDSVKDLSENTRAEIISYGFNGNPIVKAEEISSGDKKMSFKISYRGTTVPFRLPFSSDKERAYAALAAAAVGIYFGYNLVEISEIISNYKPLSDK
jgi:UDP-N-acetylmuramoyl-tripeptide--D-alanyl-D-alanine ligase